MKKKKPEIYGSYPLWMVLVYNLALLLVYLAGAYVVFRLNFIIGILYLLFLLFIEISIYREGCRYCYYYGKRCIAGKGSIAHLLIKKGDIKKFGERKLEFKDFIPQMLTVLIPLVIGIALLILRGFHLLTLIAIIYPFFS